MSLNVTLLRESFAQAAQFGDDLPKHFYQTLFLQYPEAKELFKNTNMTLQRDLLIRSLQYVIENLENPENLVRYLEAMGSRHVRYGTEELHFVWVGNSLLATFSHFFGENWTTELQEQWEQAYDFISAAMQRGMQRARQNQDGAVNKTVSEQPPVKTNEGAQVDQIQSQNKFNATFSIELPDQLKQNIRVEIRSAIQQAIQTAIRDEIETVIKEELNKIDPSQLFGRSKREAA